VVIEKNSSKMELVRYALNSKLLSAKTKQNVTVHNAESQFAVIDK
jgi:hypothetical protein